MVDVVLSDLWLLDESEGVPGGIDRRRTTRFVGRSQVNFMVVVSRSDSYRVLCHTPTGPCGSPVLLDSSLFPDGGVMSFSRLV